MNKLYELNKKLIDKIVPNKPGVYQILLYNRKEPLSIKRLLKNDRLGILSIGTSGNVNKRLKQFIEGTKKGRGHSSGNRYYYNGLDERDKLGRYTMRFRMKIIRDYEKEESRLLGGYMEYFGELPPLNNREPKIEHYDSLKFREYPKDFKW